MSLKLPLSSVHLIGHSLGAQTVAFAGKEMQVLTKGQKIGRITGLDPAGPLFQGFPSTEHLYITDADFVDVTHTDGGVFGYESADASVDFYANGGSFLQPGCPAVVFTNISDIVQANINNGKDLYIYI